jgi:hypothetical protein
MLTPKPGLVDQRNSGASIIDTSTAKPTAKSVFLMWVRISSASGPQALRRATLHRVQDVNCISEGNEKREKTDTGGRLLLQSARRLSP